MTGDARNSKTSNKGKMDPHPGHHFTVSVVAMTDNNDWTVVKKVIHLLTISHMQAVKILLHPKERGVGR
jgi:hypothetical protein